MDLYKTTFVRFSVLKPVVILDLNFRNLQPRYACEVIHKQCNQAAHTKADEQSHHEDQGKVVLNHIGITC